MIVRFGFRSMPPGILTRPFCGILPIVMLVFSLAVLLPSLLLAQGERLSISCGAGKPPSDVVTQGERKMRCDDRAIVIYQDMRVEADWIEFDKETNLLTAGDRVRFQRTGEELT